MIAVGIAFEILGAIFLFYAVDGLFTGLKDELRTLRAQWRVGVFGSKSGSALGLLAIVALLSVFWFFFLGVALATDKTRWQKK